MQDIFFVEQPFNPVPIVIPTAALQMRLVGSCLGIICMSSNIDNCLLWNPSIGVINTIEFPNLREDYSWQNLSLGFGVNKNQFYLVI